jgi:hypothetical protein
VLEIHQTGANLNLVALFNQHFEMAWDHARPVRGRTQYLWWLHRLGWELVFLVSFGLTALFLTKLPVLGNIAGGVAATALVTLLVRYRGVVGRTFRRLRG